MMDTPVLKAQTRTIIGKQVKQLRRDGKMPGVLYGHGFDGQPIMFDALDYHKLFRTAGTSTLVSLVVDDKKPVKVLLHEPDVHPAKPIMLHADFFAVKMTEKLQTEIPLHFVGESEAVDTLDGTLTTQIDAVNVECFPDALVPSIDVDITVLKTFEDIIRVGDITVPAGIEILNDADDVVASVAAPRSDEELEALDEAVTTDEEAVAAVEVAGEKKEDESEE